MAARKAPAGERMAVIETIMTEHVRNDAEAFARLEGVIGATHEAVKRIEGRLNKQMGFVAGVASVVSAAWALVVFAAAYWPFGK